MCLTSDLNNVLININSNKIHIKKFIKMYNKINHSFISKKELINYLTNNDKLIIYKNIVIIDGLDVEKEYLENLNIDFLDESINL
jgi:hypothetical protein